MPEVTSLDIKLDGIGHAISDNKLQVPLYQRSYAWEDKHIRELLQDLGDAISEDQPQYFLGSVVLSKEPKDSLEIIDGQQRITTLTIFLAAVRDYFLSQKDEDRAAHIENTYLFQKDVRTLELLPRLTLNTIDHGFFKENILERKSGDATPPKKDSHSKLLRAKELAIEEVTKIVAIGSKGTDRLLDWVEYIEKKTKVIWFEVPNQSNAYVIFETLNDRGLDLSTSDLLKNYLFALSEDRIGEVRDNWTSMVSKIEAVAEEREVVTFIRHYWSAKNGLIREKELYKVIKKSINNKRDAIELSKALDEAATEYAAIISSNQAHWDAKGPGIRPALETLNLIKFTQNRPLLLAISQKFSNKHLEKSLDAILAISVRMKILGRSGSGIAEKTYSETAKLVYDEQLKDYKDLVKKINKLMPKDAEFKEGFTQARSPSAKVSRYILRALERTATGEEFAELVPNPDTSEVNLEHILPQKKCEGWDQFTEENWGENVNRIGNLAILSVPLNSRADRKPFAEKKPFFSKSEFQLTKSIDQYDEWSPDAISRRQAVLADYAVKTWTISST